MYKKFRSLENYNANYFNNELLNNKSTLDTILRTDDVNYQVDVFTDVFVNVLDSRAPIITKQVKRPPAPWITEEIKGAMKNRDNIHKELKKNRQNQILQDQYKNEKKRVKRILQNAKSSYFRDQFQNCRGNSSKMWKTIKKVVPANNKADKLNFEDNLSKAEEFNEFFSNVGKTAYEKSRMNVIDDDHEEDNHTNLNFNFPKFKPHPVDVETVILIFKDLSNSSASGCDDITIRFLKDSLPTLILYATVIVNTSIVTFIYPSLWKNSKVIPQHKGGNEDDVNNYRPISLLPVLSKVLEKIISIQLNDYLESNNLLSKSQHGFRSGLSTETALLKISDEIYKNIDERKISLLSLCDLSKAFDSVNHNMLLIKLEQHNIDTTWFQSYLEDRYQCVHVGETISSRLPVRFGVPQGSILGPDLFKIFVNDMIRYITTCLLAQYADDSQVVHAGTIDNLEDLIERAETTLSKIKKYFDKNGLLINANKTQCIFIGLPQYISKIPNNIAIQFDGNTIYSSETVKNLGVYMDKNMSFRCHVDELNKKVTGILMYIRRMKDHFDKETRNMIVESLALSKIQYCIKVWGSAGQTQLNKVQKLQNFAAKVVDGNANKFDHVTPILADLQWLSIKKQHDYEMCVLVFKVIRKKLPEWILTIPMVGDIRPRVTRQSDDLFIPWARTDMGAKQLNIKAPNVWNLLPMHIREIQNIETFKKEIRKYFLSNF